MKTTNLRAEAAAEVRRLTLARRIVHDGDERTLADLEGRGTWIAFARKRRLERALGRRVLLVWRVVVEDASGRVVESRLVPLLVAGPVGRVLLDPAVRSEPACRHTEEAIRARVDAECEGWRDEVRRVTATFTSARARRERDIAALPSAPDASIGQPGLFDRRAARSRQAHADAIAESQRETDLRRRLIAAAADVTPRPAHLLLVLAT